MELAEPKPGIGNEFNISDDFIETNKKFKPDTRRKKGGPHTKQEIIDRKNEVYRLHFEYGYSARKIADLMKVNRNTVNGDAIIGIQKLYKTSTCLIIRMQLWLIFND